MASLTDKTIVGVVWSVSGNLAYYLVNLGVLGVLARLLSPREFGIAAGASLVLGFANMLVDLGVAPALIQRRELHPDDITTAFYGSLAMGVALCALFVALAPAIAAFLDIPELRQVIPVVSLLFVVGGVSTVARAIAERALRFRAVSQVRVVSDGLVYGAVAVPLATAGASYWSLIVAQLGATAVSTVWFYRLARHPLELRFRWRSLVELLRYGGGISLARVISYFGREGDTLVVAKAFSPTLLGLYAKAFRLMVVPATVIGAAMDRVLFPALSRARGDDDSLAISLERGVVGLSLVCLPASLVLAVLAPEVVGVVLGAGWEGAVAPLRVLALGLYFRLAYKLGGAVSLSRGAVYRNAACQAAYAFAVVGGSLVGSRWGLVGVAGAVVIALVVQFLILWSLAARVIGVALRRFLVVHAAALPVTVLVLALSLLSATALRAIDAGDLVTATGTAVVVVAGAAAACLGLPGVFLGTHGQWWLVKGKDMALARRRAP